MNFSFPNMPPPIGPGISPAALLVGRDIKAVPFLRSLVEMLLNNCDLISFVAGELSHDGTKMPGQIIIHDRNRLQTEVLPFYFNHASFASFRRNLSYFSFVRLGRGRHAGAVTYINDAVFELVDILRLKRRAVGTAPGRLAAAGTAQPEQKQQELPVQQAKRPSNLRDPQRSSQSQEPSPEVASAVISGRMHACETNHDLEDTKNNKFKYDQSSYAVTFKSTSAITLGTSSRKRVAMAADKLPSKKKRRGAKYNRSRKEGCTRVYRLLHANGIVPFIHLPVRLFKEVPQNSASQESRNMALTVTKSAQETQDGMGRKSKKRATRLDNGSPSNSSGNNENVNGESATDLSQTVSCCRKNKASSESVASALLALRSGP